MPFIRKVRVLCKMHLIFPLINGPIDCYLTYDVHVTKTVSSYMNQLVQRGRIEHLLDKKTHLLLINSLVQNFAARVVLGLKKFDHISRGRKSLKWLDVTEKVLFNDLF